MVSELPDKILQEIPSLKLNQFIALVADGNACFDQDNARTIMERELLLTAAYQKCVATIESYNNTLPKGGDKNGN